VFALVGVAAVLHVSWNVLIKTSGDPRRASTLGMAVGAVVVVPLAVAVWLGSGQPAIPTDAAALAIASGGLEAVYFVLLSAAYRRGDLSVVYPIARGTAPLGAVLVGFAILGERIGPAGWLGVALLLAGILALQQPWRAVGRALARSTGEPGGWGAGELGGAGELRGGDEPGAAGEPEGQPRAALRGGGQPGAAPSTSQAKAPPDHNADLAIALALLTGLTIVAYSAVDRVGVRLVSPWLYACIMWPVSVVGLVGWAMARGQAAFPPRGERRRGVAVGLLTTVAYLLVLVAYTLAPLAVVAPLRESAIVLASGWGAFRLAETRGSREAALRVGAAVVVLAGVVVVALGA
jgi:drug/metabolite transporter (DMT)-like permease